MSRTGIGLQVFMALGLMAAATANAQGAFMLFSGNHPLFDENVLLVRGGSGTQVLGSTNKTGAIVLFESASQFLAVPSAGQARIEAQDTNAIAAIDINAGPIAIDDDIMIALQNPRLGFRSLILNAFIGGGRGAGGELSFKIEGLDAGGGVITHILGTKPLDNGSNFFTLMATNGEIMNTVTVIPGPITSYADLRQTRIGHIVPEPSVAVLLAMMLPLVAAARTSIHNRRSARRLL